MSNNKILITNINTLLPGGFGIELFWKKLLKHNEFNQLQINQLTKNTLLKKISKKINQKIPHLNFDNLTKYTLSTADSLNFNNKSGICLGTAFGGMYSIFDFTLTGFTKGAKFCNPSIFPNTVLNSAASRVAIQNNLTELCETITTGICSGLDAIGQAYEYLISNRLHTMICGGCEEYSDYYYAMASDYTNNKKIFTKVPLSEGCALLVLKKQKLIKKESPYAEITAYSSYFDSRTLKNSLDFVINDSLKKASINIENIDLIIGNYGIYKNINDLEINYLKNKLPEKNIPILFIKTIFGESFACSSALQVAAGCLILKNNILPPHYILKEKLLFNKTKNIKAKNILIYSIDNNGNCAALILKRVN